MENQLRLSFKSCLSLLAAVSFLYAMAASGQTQTPADLLITNARIYTVNSKQPWAEAIAIRGDKIVVVGDTPHDAEAAATANMRMIGLLSGGWTEARLRQAGCIEIYRHPADFLARYNQSVLGSVQL